MAIYHKGLKYHADEIEKHDITKEELEFLIALQKEMNTQDHVGQAAPRFWIIKGSEKLYRVEGEEDGIELYDTEGCSTDADGIEEIVKYIQENFLEDINSCYGDSYKVSVKKGIFHDSIAVDNKDEMFDELVTADEITEWLHKFGYDEYEAIPYKIIPKIYEDTMFLTQKAAEEHLKRNSHHYSGDAHTYAMTAWRSPEVDRLWKVLSTVDFSRLLEV